MHADAFVVVTIQRQVQQILFAEAGDVEAAGAADALVLKFGIPAVAVLRHIGVNLIFADDDQPRAVLCHRVQNIGPAGQQMRDDVIGALQRLIGHVAGSHHGQPLHVDILFVKFAGNFAVFALVFFKQRIGGRRDCGQALQPIAIHFVRGASRGFGIVGGGYGSIVDGGNDHRCGNETCGKASHSSSPVDGRASAKDGE